MNTPIYNSKRIIRDLHCLCSIISLKELCVLFILLAYSFHSFGQEPTYFFPANIYDKYEGSSTIQVCDIAISENHKIWMITNKGLLIFDGYTWENLKDPVRIPVSITSKVKTLGERTVFIAGHDQRDMLISKFEDGKFTKYPVPEDYDVSEVKYPLEHISFDVYAENNDTTLAILLNNQLFFLRTSVGTWDKIDQSAYPDLQYIQNVRFVGNKLYVHTLSHFYELNSNEQLKRLPGQTEKGLVEILNFSARNDTIIFFTPDFLGCLENKIDTLAPISLKEELIPGKAEIIWDGLQNIYLSYKSPVYKYSLKSKTIHRIMVDHYHNLSVSNCMALDDENILWVGTDRGLLMFENFMFCYLNKNSGLLENEVAAAYESEKFGLILGSNLGFVTIKNGNLETFVMAKENDYFNFRLLDVLETKQGLLMASNFYGLTVLTDRGVKTEYPGNQLPDAEGATSSVTNYNGKILVSRGQKIYTRIGANRYEPFLEGISYIREMYAHSNGKLYISTARGLQIFDGKKLHEVPVDNFQWKNSFCTFEYDSLTLLATGYGLMKISGNSAVPFSFTNEDFHTPVYEATVDSKNRLWLGTSSGLYMYDGKIFQNYNATHGLSGNEVNRNGLFEMKNGRLLIATDRGVSFFKPEEELFNKLYPAPYIESVKIENATLKPSDSIFRIPIHEKWIEIDFGVEELKYQGSVNYRLKLEGYDNSWHYFVNEGINKMTYSNLPGGKYNLKLQARYGIGPWSSTKSNYTFELISPFYRSWWFYSLVALLTVMMTVGIHQLRIRYLTNQKSSLDKQIKDQTKVLIKQKAQLIENNQELEKALGEKTLLLKELHHRVKNNLQIITSLLNIQSNTIEDTKAIEVFRKSQNRIHAMALVHNMLYLSETIAHVNLQEYFQELIYAISSAYTHDRDNPKVMVEAQNIRLNIDDSINIGLIVNELVSNSFKYGMSNNGSDIIRIQIQQIKDGKMELTVTDSGPGLPMDFDLKNDARLGLEIVTSLTEQLSGTMEYENRNGAWFRIIFDPAGGSNSIR